jgi:FHA domain
VRPTLRITDGPAIGRRLELDGEVVIGRENADLTIADPELSRRHVALRPVEDGVEVEDLGSLNGTFVDGERIAAPTRVEADATIKAGTSLITVEFPPPPPDATVARPVVDEPEAAPDVTAPRRIQAVPEPDVTAPRQIREQPPEPDVTAPRQIREQPPEPDVTAPRQIREQPPEPDVTAPRHVARAPEPAAAEPAAAKAGPQPALIAAGVIIAVLIAIIVILLLS